MRRHLPTFLLSALILALLVWYFWPASTPVSSPPGAAPASGLTSASASASTSPAKIETPASKIAAPPPASAERSHLADDLNSPKTDLRSDLRILNEVFGAFRTNLPREGNPWGSNPEITAALTGQNKLRLALIPPDHPAISRTTGELLDRYGTPFFFHAESGIRMSITSAGPDKKLHTSDDETFTP